MTSLTPHAVVSGVPYPVTQLAGQAPQALDAFLGETDFVLDMAGQPYRVHGCGSSLEGQVRFHEKDDGLGRDIRVWHVTAVADGFVAEHVAAF